jgi:phenylalanyl-tRNA synthetase beta chain
VPTIEALFSDLQRLTGKDLPRNEEQLNDLLAYVKGEVESLTGNELSIELKDGNRPDLWSVEGIARELRGALGIETGLKPYEVKSSSGVEIQVDRRLQTIRPFIGCSVVEAVHIDDEAIRGLMHLQDKLDQTYGRRRRRASIGFYRFRLVKPPLHYKASAPNDYKFTPLDGTSPMTLKEILEHHPKGIEYAPILRDHQLWPMLVDDEDQVLSFPPIINSNTLGKITEGEEDILVEVTGTNVRTVLNTLTIVTLSLADRGHNILSARVHYPYGPAAEDTTPKLATRQVSLDYRSVNRLLGLDLTPTQIAVLLERARYGAEAQGDTIQVTIPCYRIDIMNMVDIVEDVAIGYGFNNISPIWPRISTTGGLSRLEELSNLTRTAMIGLGYQEVLTFSLTDRESQQTKMGLESLPLVELSNPSSIYFSTMRSWLTPALMAFLAGNTHSPYPQKIFEVADVETIDATSPTDVRDVRRLAALTAHSNANFSEAKSVLEAVLRGLDTRYELKETEHPSFIAGRVAQLSVSGRYVGLVGELSPKTITAWGLTNPIAGFEVDLEPLFGRLP